MSAGIRVLLDDSTVVDPNVKVAGHLCSGPPVVKE